MTIAPQFNPPASHHFTFKSSPQRLTILRQLSSSLSPTYELLRSSSNLPSFIIITLQTLRRCLTASISHQFMNLRTLGHKIGGIPWPVQSLFPSSLYKLLDSRMRRHLMRAG